MYTIGKCILFALAMLGYAMLWRRKRLPVSFFPVTAVSGVTLAVYVIGLCGSLRIGVAAVLAVGLFLLVRFFSLRELKTVMTDGSMLFCAAACVVMYAATRGQMFYDWDDGSHWYRICKALYYDGHYPTTPDIQFFDYVPGTATWVFIVLRLIGFSIPNCMFAQNCLCIAALAASFTLVEQAQGGIKKAVVAVILVAAGLMQCTFSYGVYSLLVDLPLGLLVAAAALMVVELGGRRGDLVPVGIVLAFLAIVKNSALLFIVLLCLFGVWMGRFRLRQCVMLAVSPVAAWGAYAIRSAAVFGTKGGPQSISLSRYAAMLQEKDAELIRDVAGHIFREVLRGWSAASVVMYTCLIALLLLALCLHTEGEREASGRVLRVLAACVVMLAVYIAALFLTYVFAMNRKEALTLNCFDRYFGTAVVILIGLTVYCCVHEGVQFRHGSMYLLMAVLAVFTMTPGRAPRAYVVNRNEYTRYELWNSDLWWALEWFVPENKYYTQDSYLILWNEEDFIDGRRNTLRVGVAGEAWLRSTRVGEASVSQLKSMSQEQLSSFAEYDHIVFLSDMNAQRALLEPYLAMEDYGVGMRDNLNRGQ